jgi:UDP-3-O-[3-hydroxymyristoyl] glucosamine N-acyltransferase
MPTVQEVVRFLESIGEAVGEGHPGDGSEPIQVVGPSPDQTAGPGHLAWLSPKRASREPGRVQGFAGALLLAPRDVPLAQPARGGVVVRCASPKLAFIRAVLQFFPDLSETRWPDASAGPVLDGTTIGTGSVLAAGVVIGSGVTIGDGVVIGPNSCIANCVIGTGVRIGCNCTIGLPGFGYERGADGAYWRFPHMGRVVIEDDVEIGSNTCIDRGSMGDTRIGRGSKIDNLVHIAHNVIVGDDVLLIANSMIGGSTTIEDGVWVAPSAALMNQIRIGAGAVVGLGAVVLKDVEPGAVMVGNPAKALERGKRG